MIFNLSCEYNLFHEKRNPFVNSFFQHLISSYLIFLVGITTTRAQSQYILKNGRDTISAIDSITCHGIMTKELANLYKNGYARAHWSLDTIVEIPDHLIAHYTLRRGNIILMDSALFGSNPIVKPVVLNAMMGWKKNRIFLYDELESHLKSINQSGAIRLSRPAYYFSDSTVNTRIEVKPIIKNELDGMMGLVNDNQGKAILLGQLKVKWVNALKHADEFNIHWQRQAKSTQRLQFSFQIPYCFGTQFGYSIQTDLYKKDSTFFQSNINLGVQYLFQPQQKITFQFQREKSSRLNNSDNQNIIHSLFGLAYHQRWTGNHYSLITNCSFGQGNRTLYSLDSTSQSKVWKSQIEVEIGLFYKSTFIQVAIENCMLSQEANQSIEWFRIGGNATLRGFQQESIFVRNGQILQFNVGYGNQHSSRLYLFYDWGFLNTTLKNSHERYSSFGPGAYLPTSGGNILMHYGWGMYPNTTVQLKSGVFNLSYQVYF